jgi:membrane protease YdiL (CAAX protease family)
MSPPGSEAPRPFPLLFALGLTALGIVAMIGGAPLLGPSGLGLRAQIALGTLLLALPSLAALAVAPDRGPAVAGRPATQRMLALSFLLGAALWVASAGLMEVQSLIAPPSQEYLDLFRALHHALAPRNAADALLSIAVIAVLPGLCEELVVRGVLLPSLAAVIRGAAGPIVLTALLFAGIHRDPYRFAFTFALGLVFGLVRLATRSLWPSVVAHLTLNTLTFLVAPFVDDPTQAYTPNGGLGALFLLAGSAITWPLVTALMRSVDSTQGAT